MTDAIVTDKKELSDAEKEFRKKFMEAVAFYDNYKKRLDANTSNDRTKARQALQNAELFNPGVIPPLFEHLIYFCTAKDDEEREKALVETWEHFQKTAK